MKEIVVFYLGTKSALNSVLPLTDEKSWCDYKEGLGKILAYTATNPCSRDTMGAKT